MPEYTGPHMKQIGLLILQPSPFCNIDCDYCYLAERSSTKKMSSGMPASLLRFRLLIMKKRFD